MVRHLPALNGDKGSVAHIDIADRLLRFCADGTFGGRAPSIDVLAGQSRSSRTVLDSDRRGR